MKKQTKSEAIRKEENSYLRLPLSVRYFIEKYTEACAWEDNRAVEYSEAFARECKRNYVDPKDAIHLFNMCRVEFRADHSAENQIAEQKAKFEKVNQAAHKSLESRWQITMCAEQNALDTAREHGYKSDYDFPTYWEIALGTIADSMCNPETTNADRKFFAKFGIVG
jgi:hypothetical protein